MAKHPAEVFGYPVDVSSVQAQDARQRHWCPFVEEECNKASRLISYPMGVCSVQYANHIIALSPRRFLQDRIVFREIAYHYFGSHSDLLLFGEVGVGNVGTFDYVMVKHKPLSSDIEDFVVIEFQTAQTTGTGSLVKAFQDFMQSKKFETSSYGFGLNLADIWKRSFTQILNKGIVLEQWDHKIYWVVQEPVYQDLLERYNLNGMGYDPEHKTVFTIYDLRRNHDKYELFRTRIESSSTDTLFAAFRKNPNIPPLDAFIDKLKNRLRARMELKFRLD